MLKFYDFLSMVKPFGCTAIHSPASELWIVFAPKPYTNSIPFTSEAVKMAVVHYGSEADFAEAVCGALLKGVNGKVGIFDGKLIPLNTTVSDAASFKPLADEGSFVYAPYKEYQSIPAAIAAKYAKKIDPSMYAKINVLGAPEKKAVLKTPGPGLDGSITVGGVKLAGPPLKDGKQFLSAIGLAVCLEPFNEKYDIASIPVPAFGSDKVLQWSGPLPAGFPLPDGMYTHCNPDTGVKYIVRVRIQSGISFMTDEKRLIVSKRRYKTVFKIVSGEYVDHLKMVVDDEPKA